MAGEQLVRVDGRRLRLSNLDKVLYPETGTTKGEVIDYYSRIAPLLVPHVEGRPVTRKRWPEGVGTADHPEDSFFGKQLEAGAPAWIPRRPIEHSTGAKDYPLVDDRATLVYLAQVASLELHVPQWRFTHSGERGNPDRIVLDLDPGPGLGLAACAEVARYAKDILEGMGLAPMPVTSGSKGIHLYAALDGRQTSDQISALAKELARSIEADHPDLVVSAMAKSARPGRVFIDWSQNNGSKTTIAPYSLRGRARPWVAAPRTWDELDDPDFAQLEMADVLDRSESPGDPLLDAGIDVRAAPTRLAAYISKRSADRTPEPFPRDAAEHDGTGNPDDENRFVIQEHHASRLHWDLRLERDGVLVSWAVPRGIPPTADRNNLAIMTEDHPLEYLDFHGEIPAGQYGAGSMTVWDTGRYDLEKWRDDEVIATLEGRPDGPMGRVRIALIRTDGAGEKSTWLLHRMKTDADGRPQGSGAPVVARNADEAADSPAVHESETDAGSTAIPVQPMLATASTPGLARDAQRRAAEDGDAPWVEFKWDGVRAIARWHDGHLRLWGRRGNEITDRYPDLTSISVVLDATNAVLDGEIVALDEHGAPSFSLLQNRMHLARAGEIAAEARRTPVRLYLYDLLSLNGRDVTGLPLRDRRELLERVTAPTAQPVSVPPVVDDVDAALDASRELGIEGIVVKRPASRYRPGVRSDDWLKVKIVLTQEVVIGGIRPGRGGRSGSIGSLLVGVPDETGLRYVGRVGSGFSDATLARLREVLEPLRTDADPFVDVPAADASDALWVSPETVAEVAFSQWTPTGVLWHARWRGLRPDKDPAEVVRES